jgi:virulence-associated protein VagC
MDTAKIFWTGEFQTVRLPKDYRLPANEVRVRRHGNAVILEPIPENWQWLDAALVMSISIWRLRSRKSSRLTKMPILIFLNEIHFGQQCRHCCPQTEYHLHSPDDGFHSA